MVQGQPTLEGLGMSQFWVDRPTLVTGVTGLVGGWLAKALVARRADVVGVVRDLVPQAEVHRSGADRSIRQATGDVVDQAFLERVLNEYEIDTVFHLAAQTIVGVANRNPISTFDSNIRGTWSLLEACRRAPTVKQVIIASSDKAYGDQDDLPYRETAPLQGMHPYDCSKSCADLLSQCYAHSFKLPVAITRCGNFYGGGDLNWNRLIPGTIRSVLGGQRPVIRSDGSLIRDYFYVEDGVHAYMTLAEALASRRELAGEAFNFSNEQQITVLQLVERILKAMGSPLEPDVRNEAFNEIRHQHLSAEKARTTLGWKPLFNIDEGLRRTIEWYREEHVT